MPYNELSFLNAHFVGAMAAVAMRDIYLIRKETDGSSIQER